MACSTKSFQTFRVVFGLLVAVATVRIFNADLDKYTTENGRRLQDDAVNNAKSVFDIAAKSVVYIDCFGLEMSDEEGIPNMPGEDGIPNKRTLAQKAPRQTALDRKVGNLEGKMVPVSSGSGFIWDGLYYSNEGIVITNYHVIKACADIEISLLSKTDESQENKNLFPTTLHGRDPSIGEADEYHWKVVEADVVGADPVTDIAVLRFDASNVEMSLILRGDDKKVGTGEECFAIGNP